MVQISKADARKALVLHHFEQLADQRAFFNKFHSVQFDPIAPVGCNHDLVLQARLPKYKIGDWQNLAYQDRFIYDGWDKQASLVPYTGWPLRRLIHDIHRKWFEKRIFEGHPEAVELILKELTDKGPLQPKDFDFQLRKDDWKVSWFGPSVTKQTLRALWHSGMIMTTDRKGGQHVYDLTERVMPKEFLSAPRLKDDEARVELALERHRTMGILRPTAQPEVWSMEILNSFKRKAVTELLAQERIVPVEIEGVKANVCPEFLHLLDAPAPERRVTFVAPLDPFMWDRRMVAELFGFDYIWEIYTPEHKRKWGYYVLPVLYGTELVARIEFWCRKGVLEIRAWHEERDLPKPFSTAFEKALKRFMQYSGSHEVACVAQLPRGISDCIAGFKT